MRIAFLELLVRLGDESLDDLVSDDCFLLYSAPVPSSVTPSAYHFCQVSILSDRYCSIINIVGYLIMEKSQTLEDSDLSQSRPRPKIVLLRKKLSAKNIPTIARQAKLILNYQNRIATISSNAMGPSSLTQFHQKMLQTLTTGLCGRRISTSCL